MAAGIFITLAVIATLISIFLLWIANSTNHMGGIVVALWGFIGAIISVVLWIITIFVW